MDGLQTENEDNIEFCVLTVCMAAGLEVSGQLLHKDDVFVHVSHKDGYEGPMPVEEEGFLAGSPLVGMLLSQTAMTACRAAVAICRTALKRSG